MRMSPKIVLASAVALLLGWALVATTPVSGQDQPAAPETAAPAEADGPAAKKPQVPVDTGSTSPPKNLKKVGDHWTPYDPPDPETFPKDATLHVIVPGDTLWDLADLAFGNPYLWPQIWNENRYILDSHWIYPGDPLLLPPRPTVVSEVVPQGQEGAPAVALPPPTAPAAPAEQTEEEEQPAEPLAAEAPAPAQVAPPEVAHAPRTVQKIEPLADDKDMRCSGFIAKRDNKADYFIANQMEETRLAVTEGDLVYLNRGKQNGHVEPGTEYSVIVRLGEVMHPITGKRLGVYYKRLGTVKVLAYQEYTAIGRVTMACDEIRSGYDLVPLNVTPLPAKPAPPFSRIAAINPDKPSGYIVHVEDNVRRVGTGATVDIDLGFDDGIKPGDYLMVYLPAEGRPLYSSIKFDYRLDNFHMYAPDIHVDHKNELPSKVIGQAVVLLTERHTATVKIIQAVREIEVGQSIAMQ